MLQQKKADSTAPLTRDWTKALAKYRKPSHLRSILELAMTGVPFLALWTAAWWSISISYWLTLALCIPAAGLLVRLFLIQHDCGHGAFFRNRKANNWVGRVLGILTFTPYEVWRRDHALHHASSGNLDKRGFGDILTLTVEEYMAKTRWQRLSYRLYRNPIVMFGIGPAYVYLLRNRIPLGFMRSPHHWVSAMGTNVAAAIVAAIVIYFVGFGPFFMVLLPITLLAASFGVWLFYVQHQFEETVWEKDPSWDLHDAALYGSSHYDLPKILRWFSANIGIHHVHHLYSKIPFYRLPQVLRDYPELASIKRLTLMESFSTVKLRLWDEGQKKLVSFRTAYALHSQKAEPVLVRS